MNLKSRRRTGKPYRGLGEVPGFPGRLEHCHVADRMGDEMNSPKSIILFLVAFALIVIVSLIIWRM